MGEESKMILEQLGQINQSIGEMRADIKELKTDVAELKTDVAELKTDVAELKTDVAELKTDVAELKTDVADLKNRVTNLEEGQKSLYSLIENDISKKITIIGEGHFFVMKALNELRGFQDEKEMMDLKILDLQIDMKLVKHRLKIA